jgi:hypothetical protein
MPESSGRCTALRRSERRLSIVAYGVFMKQLRMVSESNGPHGFAWRTLGGVLVVLGLLAGGRETQGLSGRINGRRGSAFLRNSLLGLFGLMAASATMTARAEIPQAERQVLLNLYASTGGGNWTQRDNWNGPVGTECTWVRVTCDANQTHVISIDMVSNNLTGTLPDFRVLTALQFFSVDQNALTGSIPPIAGLTALQQVYFSHNQLTGSIPPLTDLTSLQVFYAHVNHLTGSIPDISGLTSLQSFGVSSNQLTGSLPTLSSFLIEFYADHNQLTGSIPAILLPRAQYFYINDNQLTGPIPDFSHFRAIVDFYVSNNQLTGPVPAPPFSLEFNGSALCPNAFDLTPSSNDAGWDAATGKTPWWADPYSNNRCDDIFSDGFGG